MLGVLHATRPPHRATPWPQRSGRAAATSRSVSSIKTSIARSAARRSRQPSGARPRALAPAACPVGLHPRSPEPPIALPPVESRHLATAYTMPDASPFPARYRIAPTGLSRTPTTGSLKPALPRRYQRRYHSNPIRGPWNPRGNRRFQVSMGFQRDAAQLPCRRSRVRVPSAAPQEAPQIAGFFVARSMSIPQCAALYNKLCTTNGARERLPARRRGAARRRRGKGRGVWRPQSWHCASGLGDVSDAPAPRKQSCARRRPAATGVIQMSPRHSSGSCQRENECDSAKRYKRAAP